MISGSVRFAAAADAEALTELINLAFRVERPFKNRERTTAEHVRALMSSGRILVLDSAGGQPSASAYVELRPVSVYIGLVSVHPTQQKTGLGRLMMDEAERYGVEHGRSRADITVVSVRPELLPFYRRLGYVEDGVEPFPDPAALTRECHLIRMWKAIGSCGMADLKVRALLARRLG